MSEADEPVRASVSPEQRLANDIAVQFAHLPTAEAARHVTRHIRSFWDPRMRARLLTLDPGDPIVVAAVDLLRSDQA